MPVGMKPAGEGASLSLRELVRAGRGPAGGADSHSHVDNLLSSASQGRPKCLRDRLVRQAKSRDVTAPTVNPSTVERSPDVVDTSTRPSPRATASVSPVHAMASPSGA